jgi:hypothetical protein
MVLAGNDEAHPFPISEEVSKLLPKCEFIPEWKQGAPLAAAKVRIKEFLAGNTVPLAKGVAALDGLVIGLLNNSKAGTRPFLDRVAALLQRDHGVSRIVRYDKAAAALPAPDDMLEAAARECDVVINGIAD